MFSYYAVLVYLAVGAAAVLAGIDALLRVRTARRPASIAVLVLAIVLLVAILTLPLHGLIVLVAVLTVALLIALIVDLVTAGAGRRRVLTIVALVVTVLALVTLWLIVGLTLA